MISRLFSIAGNTFIESLRRPVFLAVLATVCLLLALNPAISTLTLGEDDRLLVDLGLSTILLGGIFLSAFISTGSISREIDSKTILTILSKPVGKLCFIAGKYLGVCATISLAGWIWSLVFLLGVRHGAISAAWESSDGPVLVFGLGAAIISVAIASWGNYARDWNFATSVSLLLAALLPLAWTLVLLIAKDWSLQGLQAEFTAEEKQLGQVLLALALALQALWILAAIAIACSTRLGQLATLLISFGAFLLGLSSDSLFGGPGREKTLAKIAYGITPNLQFHWLADALSLGNPASGFYLLLVSGYTIIFIGAILCLAAALFEGRETG